MSAITDKGKEITYMIQFFIAVIASVAVFAGVGHMVHNFYLAGIAGALTLYCGAKIGS